MTQITTTSGYATNVAAAYRQVGYGVLIAWQRTIASNVSFFTVGTSLIAGNDMIKGGGSFVTFFDKFAYNDYSSYTMSWAVTRKLGQYPFGTILAQADLELDNTSKLFYPDYDATIGSGILPNRPLRISASIGAESLTQFVGFTGQPELSLMNRKVTLHAYDVLDYIQNYSFTSSGTTTSGLAGTTTSGYLVGNRVDQAIAYYLGQLGFSSNQYVLDQGLQAPIGYLPVADRKLGDVFNDLIQAEQGMLFADENGLPRFWNRQHFLTTSGTYQFQLTFSNMADLEFENTPIINDVIVRAQPRSVQSRQKVWELNSATQLPPNSSTVVFANFQDDFGDLPVTAVDTPINLGSATSSYFSSNTSSDGTGTGGSASVSLTGVYLFGTSYKMTFVNTSANAVYITALVLFGTPAKVTTQIEQRYLDSASIDAYGRNPANNSQPLEISNDYIQDSSTAYSLAYTLVNEYNLPRKRYKVKTFADPARQIGDFGQLTNASTRISRNVWVVGTQLTMARNGDLQQILEVEERQIKSYFMIGTSLIAGTDQIAP